MRSTRFLVKVALVAALTITFSCKKYLDENVNKSTISEDVQWSSETNADIFLNSVYGQLAAMHNTPDYLDSFTDDNDGGIYWRSWQWRQGVVDPTTAGGVPQGDAQGGPAFNVTSSNYAVWDMTFARIRRCNLFIERVTANKGGVFSATWSAKRLDEVRFLRAYWYAMLWQHVGGLPIITKTLNNQDGSEIFYERSTFEATLDFIVAELDAIIANNKLAVKYNNGNADAGRATLGAALMVKGWVQLYAASPLFNSPGGYVLADPGHFVSFATPNNARWATAAATFKKFMDTYTQYSLFPKMSEFWFVANEYNSEVIWDRQHVSGAGGGGIQNNVDQYGGPVWIHNTYYTWGNYNPTQELVDTYRMANGQPPFIYPGGVKTINPLSGYDPQKPYVGREQRFYDFIVYDGATYKQDWMPTADIIYFRIDKVKPSKNEIDFGSTDNSNTGYYFKKKLNNLAPLGGNQSGQNYVYFRFAEVLLGYAEAQNEALAAPDASVYQALNLVRNRPSTNIGNAPVGMTKDEMRQEIKDQRRIEFAFEAKRFYDLMRWKDAKAKLSVNLHAMKITNTVPADNSGVWFYEEIVLGGRNYKFTDKMYMNPVPQSVIDVNPKLKTQQNPGY